jgi:hypothetical protein
MKIQVGDIIYFPGWNDGPGSYYLILDTRKKSRYDVLFLWDGKITQLDKNICKTYGQRVA